MTDYLVIYEGDHEGWSAYSVDLPCYAAGETREEVERLMQEAIPLYFERLRELGESIPAPTSSAGYVAA